jgi:hypothetical protein
MPRPVLPLVLLALAGACDRATDPTDVPVTSAPRFVAAGKAVDPAALTPAVLPPTEASCQADGRWITCHTTLVFDLVNEPAFDLSCGTLYETSHDLRLGIRWYDASDSVIVKRSVRQEASGEWSLSADGSGPTVHFSIRANWQDSQYADPNDLDSGLRNYEGRISAQAPEGGVIAIIAGLDEPDGTHHGVLRSFEDPAVEAKVCAALGA